MRLIVTSALVGCLCSRSRRGPGTARRNREHGPGRAGRGYPGCPGRRAASRAGRVGLDGHRRDRAFRFPALAPGASTSRPHCRFTPFKFERVEALLGQINGLRSCSNCGHAEEVHGHCFSPLVDMSQSARVFSLRQDTIDLLPKGRDFTTLVSQAPGANQEPKLGGISIDGSSASENRFVVNGVETTNLFSGVSATASCRSSWMRSR